MNQIFPKELEMLKEAQNQFVNQNWRQGGVIIPLNIKNCLNLEIYQNLIKTIDCNCSESTGKTCVGFFLFMILCLSSLIMAFDIKFYDEYLDRLSDNLGGDYRWAKALEESSKESRIDMWRGLMATILFSGLTCIISLSGIFWNCINPRGKSLFIYTFLSSLIGLLISVAVWLGADKSDEKGIGGFHKQRKDEISYFLANNKALPQHLIIWKEAYYISVVCMPIACFFGIIVICILQKTYIINSE